MPPRKFQPFPFPYHAEIEVEIADLTNLGHGLGRVPLPDGSDGGRGWVVLVPFALPGERVLARVWRNQHNLTEADLVRVLRASPDRTEPRCPLFGRCGGCQYQNLGYAAQLAWKRSQVAGLLRHLAGIEVPVDPVVPSPRPWNYRAKITPHHPPARDGRAPPLGFLRAGSRHDVVDVPYCHLADDALNARLAEIRAEFAARPPEGKRGATLLLRLSSAGVTSDPRAVAVERVGGLEIEFPAGDFFQNNPHILPEFTAHVAAEAARHGATCLVDAYCGSGLFALTAAARFRRVEGVEISEAAVERARRNAARNGIAAGFLAADAAAIFAGLDFPGADAAVVLDPPRKGGDEVFLRQLLAFGPRTIVYVSCDPATQMRDLRLLVAGGYAVERVRPFDLFPQTRHLECVATLRRG